MSSYVYLIHFDQPIGNPLKAHGQARHYMGFTTEGLKKRIRRHRSGNGSRIMEVVTQRGITWRLARTWLGGRQLEKQLKGRHDAPRLCPICKKEKTQC